MDVDERKEKQARTTKQQGWGNFALTETDKTTQQQEGRQEGRKAGKLERGQERAWLTRLTS